MTSLPCQRTALRAYGLLLPDVAVHEIEFGWLGLIIDVGPVDCTLTYVSVNGWDNCWLFALIHIFTLTEIKHHHLNILLYCAKIDLATMTSDISNLNHTAVTKAGNKSDFAFANIAFSECKQRLLDVKPVLFYFALGASRTRPIALGASIPKRLEQRSCKVIWFKSSIYLDVGKYFGNVIRDIIPAISSICKFLPSLVHTKL